MTAFNKPQVPTFQQIQRAFADHIKQPAVCAKPADVDDRHMAVYRDLFFKNIMGFISGAFPVLADILGEQRWQQLGRAFFSQHANASPLFLDISREFLTFLQYQYEPIAQDPPYVFELAHYEWLELYVDVTTETHSYPAGYYYLANQAVLAEESFLVLSPVVEGHLYRYPVHRVSSENPHAIKQPTALIVYRAEETQGEEDDTVKFAETNPFTLQLLERLKNHQATSRLHNSNKTVLSPWVGKDLINDLLLKAELTGSEVAYRGGVDTLQQWLSMGIIRAVDIEQ